MSTHIPEPQKTKAEEIRALVEQGAYTVDAASVADAIVERLLEGRSVRKAGT